MKQLYVDRLEGKYLICEDDDHRYYAIEIGEAPQEAGPGDVLQITDEGELSVDREETQRRKALMAKKQRKAIED